MQITLEEQKKQLLSYFDKMTDSQRKGLLDFLTLMEDKADEKKERRAD